MKGTTHLAVPDPLVGGLGPRAEPKAGTIV